MKLAGNIVLPAAERMYYFLGINVIRKLVPA